MPYYCCPRCGCRQFLMYFDDVVLAFTCNSCYLNQGILREELSPDNGEGEVDELITFFDKVHTLLKSNPERTG